VILEEYERLLGPRTRIVSLTQVSNALGTITPAREARISIGLPEESALAQSALREVLRH